MTEYTDPPDMPDDERMTDAEIKTIREFLGVTGEWLAGHLGVSSRTVRHWEQGKYPVPDGVRLAVESLEERTGEYIGRLVDWLNDEPEPQIVTYRDDEEYQQADPRSPYSASWHRAVVARTALEVRGLAIQFPRGAVARVRITAGPPPQAAIVAFGGDLVRKCSERVAQLLADAGVVAEQMTWERSLKGQMKEAGRTLAPYTVIIGEREAEAATVTVKDMLTSTQNTVGLDAVAGAVGPLGATAAA